MSAFRQGLGEIGFTSLAEVYRQMGIYTGARLEGSEASGAPGDAVDEIRVSH
jgi:hypothetical protein